MLSRSQKLSTEQFNVVMEKGRVVHSPLFLMRLIGKGQSTRISAVASKKVAKTAVDRNRTRRQIYAALRPVFAQIHPGVHAIVFSKGFPADIDPLKLQSEIRDLFVKAGVLK